MVLRSSGLKRWYLIIASLLILSLCGYWLKDQIGINVFDSISISSYFPFKYLANNVIRSPKPGILLNDNFNTKLKIGQWSELWMKEAGAVSKEMSADGFNGSKCLLIRSSSDYSWTISHNKRVEVKKGDIFYFNGLVKIKGDNPFAYMSVSAFDEHKEVAGWHVYKEKVSKTDVWVGIEKHFTISDDDIKHIIFRLAGMGKGEYRFDEITFRKLK